MIVPQGKAFTDISFSMFELFVDCAGAPPTNRRELPRFETGGEA